MLYIFFKSCIFFITLMLAYKTLRKWRNEQNKFYLTFYLDSGESKKIIMNEFIMVLTQPQKNSIQIKDGSDKYLKSFLENKIVTRLLVEKK